MNHDEHIQCCERDHNHDGNCDRHPAHAHRRDFMRYWNESALPILMAQGATKREIEANMHAAWQQWLKESI